MGGAGGGGRGGRGGLHAPGTFSGSFTKEATVITSCLMIFAHQTSSEEGVYSKRDVFVPLESKFFFLRNDPSSKGGKLFLTITSTESVPVS